MKLLGQGTCALHMGRYGQSTSREPLSVLRELSVLAKGILRTYLPP